MGGDDALARAFISAIYDLTHMARQGMAPAATRTGVTCGTDG